MEERSMEIIHNLIITINNTFDCMDIDNDEFITFICHKTGLCRDEYNKIMKI